VRHAEKRARRQPASARCPSPRPDPQPRTRASVPTRAAVPGAMRWTPHLRAYREERRSARCSRPPI
jgi:hypothetical protein